MKIRYLGTGAAEGWPGLFCTCEMCARAKAEGGKNIRTRSQAVIDETLLIDFPPDTYLHMLLGGLNLPSIRDVLITHTHQDHFYPEDLAMRCPGFAHGVEEPLTLHGSDALMAAYNRYIGSEAYHAQLEGVLACRELTPFVPVEIGGYRVTPLLANHAKHMTCLIYAIERGGKRLLYGNDTGIFPQQTWEAIAGQQFDLVSLDCTTLRHREGTNHMGIEDVLEVRRRMFETGCATETGTTFVITHFSHNGGLLHHEIEERAAPYGIVVAYDGCAVTM